APLRRGRGHGAAVPALGGRAGTRPAGAHARRWGPHRRRPGRAPWHAREAAPGADAGAGGRRSRRARRRRRRAAQALRARRPAAHRPGGGAVARAVGVGGAAHRLAARAAVAGDGGGIVAVGRACRSWSRLVDCGVVQTLAVLASGQGTNFEALVLAERRGELGG